MKLEGSELSIADRVEFLTTLGQACLKSDRLGIGSASYVSNLLSVSIVALTPIPARDEMGREFAL